MLALLAGGVLTQLPPALGDDSQNPFSALWAAIFDLQNRDEDLQAQIDELRAERDGLLIESAQSGFASDTYTNIEVEATEDGRTLFQIAAGNNGPDRAAGVKLTAFYLMPLYKINSINDDRCENRSRGIIECTLGTLEAHQESVITIDTFARESGKENKWTADISTTTDDVDYTNNHMTSAFATGGAEPVETPEEQSVLQDDASDVPGAVSEEDSGSSANSTSAETEESQSAGNQTSDETGEETVNDTNSTSTEQSEDSQSFEETQQTSEGSGESSSETSNGQTEQQSESGTGESSEDSDEPGTEESSSEQSATDASESSDSAENLSQ
jgi:hypothetical protein